MNKNSLVWIALITIVAASLAVYSTYFNQVRDLPEQHSEEAAKLECWIYTDTWGPILEQFQEAHPEIGVTVRQFRSYADLYDELLTSISVRSAPDLAELNSAYGLAELHSLGVLAPAADYLPPSEAADIGAAFRSAFTYRDALRAVPAGASIPVLFYNRDLAKRAGLEQNLSFPDMESLGRTVRTWSEKRSVEGALPVGELQWLTVDRNFPYLFLSLWEASEEGNRRDRLQRLLGMWEGLAAQSVVMKPLQHDLALSNFITGRTLFFAASSERKIWLERYIGGKFGYGMLPLPGTEERPLLPDVSAFAVFTMNGQVNTAGGLVRFLLSKEIQEKLMDTTGYLPVRKELGGKLQGDPAVAKQYARLWQDDKPRVRWTAEPDDRSNWRLLTEALLQMEAGTDGHDAASVEKLLRVMP